MDVPRLMRQSLKQPIQRAAADVYGAPFPSARFQVGALASPQLVPIRRDRLAAVAIRAAIEILKTLEIPALLQRGYSDPITGHHREHLARVLRKASIPDPLANAGHFIQEDAGLEACDRILEWMQSEGS